MMDLIARPGRRLPQLVGDLPGDLFMIALCLAWRGRLLLRSGWGRRALRWLCAGCLWLGGDLVRGLGLALSFLFGNDQADMLLIALLCGRLLFGFHALLLSILKDRGATGPGQIKRVSSLAARSARWERALPAAQ